MQPHRRDNIRRMLLRDTELFLSRQLKDGRFDVGVPLARFYGRIARERRPSRPQ